MTEKEETKYGKVELEDTSEQHQQHSKAELEEPPCLYVDAALSSIGTGRFQHRVFALCALGILGDATEKASLMYILQGVAAEWGVEGEALGLLGSSSGLGQAVGATAFGRLSDRWGRRASLLLALGWTFAVGGLCAVAPNYPSFLLLRFVINIGLGGALPIGFTLVAEVLPEEDRSRWSPILYASYGSGRLFAAALALLLLDVSWRIFMLCIAVPSGVLLLFFRWMPETPQWLVDNNRESDARRLIEEIASVNGVVSPLDPEVPLRNKNVASETSHLSAVFTLTSVLLSIIWFILAVGTEWTNWLLKILLAAGVPQSMALRGLVACNTNELVVPFLVALLPPTVLSRHMRFSLVTFSALASAATAILAVLLSLHASPLKLVTSSVLAAYSVIFTWVVLYTLTPAMFPSETRGTAFGFCMTCNRLGYIVGPLVGAVLVERANQLMFGCAACFVVLALLASFLGTQGT